MIPDQIQTSGALLAGILIPAPDGGEKGETSDFASVFAEMMVHASSEQGADDSSGMAGLESGYPRFISLEEETGTSAIQAQAVYESVVSEYAAATVQPEAHITSRENVPIASDSRDVMMIDVTPGRAITVTTDGDTQVDSGAEAPVVVFAFPVGASHPVTGNETDTESSMVYIPARIENVRFEDGGEALVFTAVAGNVFTDMAAGEVFGESAGTAPKHTAIVPEGIGITDENPPVVYVSSDTGKGRTEGQGRDVPAGTPPVLTVRGRKNLQPVKDMLPSGGNTTPANGATVVGTIVNVQDTPVSTAFAGQNVIATRTEVAEGQAVLGTAAEVTASESTASHKNAPTGPRIIRVEFVMSGEGAKIVPGTPAGDVVKNVEKAPETNFIAKNIILPGSFEAISPADGDASSVGTLIVEAAGSGSATAIKTPAGQGSLRGMVELLASISESSPIELVFRIDTGVIPETDGVNVLPSGGPAERNTAASPAPTENGESTAAPMETFPGGTQERRESTTIASDEGITRVARERTFPETVRISRVRDVNAAGSRIAKGAVVLSENDKTANSTLFDVDTLTGASKTSVSTGDTTIENIPAQQNFVVSGASNEEHPVSSLKRTMFDVVDTAPAKTVDDQVAPEIRILRDFAPMVKSKPECVDFGPTTPVTTERETPAPAIPLAEMDLVDFPEDKPADAKVRITVVGKNVSEDVFVTPPDASAGKMETAGAHGNGIHHSIKSVAYRRLNASGDTGSSDVRPVASALTGEISIESDASPSHADAVHVRSVVEKPETADTVIPGKMEIYRPRSDEVLETEAVISSYDEGVAQTSVDADSPPDTSPSFRRALHIDTDTKTNVPATKGRVAEGSNCGDTRTAPVRNARVEHTGNSGMRVQDLIAPAPGSSGEWAPVEEGGGVAVTETPERVVTSDSRREADNAVSGDDRIRLVRYAGQAVEAEPDSPSQENTAPREVVPRVRRVTTASSDDSGSIPVASAGFETAEPAENPVSTQAVSPDALPETSGKTATISSMGDSVAAEPAFAPETITKPSRSVFSMRRNGDDTTTGTVRQSADRSAENNDAFSLDGDAFPVDSGKTAYQKGREPKADAAAPRLRGPEPASASETPVFVPVDGQGRIVPNEKRASRTEKSIERAETRVSAADLPAVVDSAGGTDAVSQIRPILRPSADVNATGRPGVFDASGKGDMSIQSSSTDAGTGLFAAGTEKTGLAQESRRTTETARSGGATLRHYDIESGVMTTVVRQARILLQNRQSSATVVLEPPSLGRMTLDIVTGNAKITGRITVESREVQDIIRSNIADLRQTLAQNGYMVESFDVQVGHNGGTDSWARREDFQNLAALADTGRKTFSGIHAAGEEYEKPVGTVSWSPGKVDIWI